MGILHSVYPPCTALTNARRRTRTEALHLVRNAGIIEYGLSSPRTVAEEWELKSKEKPVKIIGSLDNSDTEQMLLAILRENTAAVVEGLAIAAYVTGAGAIEIVIPEEDPDLYLQIRDAAGKCGTDVAVTTGIVDVRAAENYLVHHLETAAALADLFAGPDQYEKTTVVAVKRADQPVGEPLEIAYGRTIEDIVGCGLKENLKAVGIGTRVYDVSVLDLVLDETFPLENGVISLFDSKCCMADQAEKAILAVRNKSCGKCTFCREGTIQIHTMFKDITAGKGKTTDPAMIQEICEAMSYSCMCSLGQSGGRVALTLLQLFGEEIEAHIRRKTCPAGVCKAFLHIYINPLTCDGCGDCADVCPEDCIEGKPGFIYMIDEFDCTKCGRCMESCPKGSIVSTSFRLPRLPDKLTKVGRFK